MFWHSKKGIVNLDKLLVETQGAPTLVPEDVIVKSPEMVDVNAMVDILGDDGQPTGKQRLEQRQESRLVERTMQALVTRRRFDQNNPVHVQALAVYEELRRLDGKRMDQKTARLLGQVANLTAEIVALSNQAQTTDGLSASQQTQLTQHLSDYHAKSRQLRKNPVLNVLGFLVVGLLSLAILAASGMLLAASLGLVAFIPPGLVAVFGPMMAALKTGGSIAVGSAGVVVGAGVGLTAGSMFSRMLRTQAVRREMHAFESVVRTAQSGPKGGM
jgi:hypothetical protein